VLGVHICVLVHLYSINISTLDTDIIPEDAELVHISISYPVPGTYLPVEAHSIRNVKKMSELKKSLCLCFGYYTKLNKPRRPMCVLSSLLIHPPRPPPLLTLKPRPTNRC